MTDTPLTTGQSAFMVNPCAQCVALREQLATLQRQVQGLREALRYCALPPGMLDPAAQAQFMIAQQALATPAPPSVPCAICHGELTIENGAYPCPECVKGL